MHHFGGVYLPLITPFLDDAVDHESLERLIDHYAGSGFAGFVLLGTTAESPTVEADEQAAIVEATLGALDGSLPVFVGVGGSSTRQVARKLATFERFGVDGYLVVTPYYNRPSQDGLVEHYRAVAGETEKPIIVYNVPYRTGVNLANETLVEIATTIPNVRAVKDSTGNIGQSLELLRTAPETLAVLTGEDPLFFTSMANGAAGGILAASHVHTGTFVAVANHLVAGDVMAAREAWQEIAGAIPLLFGEANPMPLKYVLWCQGLIRSPECRLPLTRISAGLAATLDEALGLPDS